MIPSVYVYQWRIANLEGGQRGYGKVDMPQVSITFSGTLLELNRGHEIRIPLLLDHVAINKRSIYI